MSRLGGDPHPRTTARKPSSGFTSAAARLLLRHDGRKQAANSESIEFFSALRKCLPDPPHVSGQTGEIDHIFLALVIFDRLIGVLKEN